MSEHPIDTTALTTLSSQIKQWAQTLGFNHCAVSDTQLDKHETHLLNWLDAGFHGDMDYMKRHGTKRSRPAELEVGTVRVVSVRMDYFPSGAANADAILQDNQLAYVSRYALGRDYHKLMRQRLQKLARQITEHGGEQSDNFSYRAFVDSAPVLEKALAEKAGLGWIGKHSNLLSTTAGSWFFLGELFINLPLPVDKPLEQGHCGSCTACIQTCPTNAIVAPYKVDARRCISYHTIELRTSIPLEFRKAIGNRIYGCDDCQLVCPFNKFSSATKQIDFEPRHLLDKTPLTELFAWSEEQFYERMEGSAIRRIGYECWLRNIAVALGNADTTQAVLNALNARANDPSELVKEHVTWALQEHAS
ncbi:MAG: tRNA epoxyqueuosine(34) reductase QueG [Granulosicoccaceae bacterium]